LLEATLGVRRELALPGRRDRTRLVVDDGEPAVGVAFDAVGGCCQDKCPCRAGELQPTLDLRVEPRDPAAPFALVVHEPARDALEARPPEGADGRPVHLRTEFLSPDRRQAIE